MRYDLVRVRSRLSGYDDSYWAIKVYPPGSMPVILRMPASHYPKNEAGNDDHHRAKEMLIEFIESAEPYGSKDQ